MASPGRHEPPQDANRSLIDAPECECGHPLSAHRWRNGYDRYSRRVLDRPCVATVTRRHEHGDDAWPCPCEDFREAKT